MKKRPRPAEKAESKTRVQGEKEKHATSAGGLLEDAQEPGCSKPGPQEVLWIAHDSGYVVRLKPRPTRIEVKGNRVIWGTLPVARGTRMSRQTN